MSYAAYQQRVAAEAAVDQRIDFIRKTYLHLGGAILACIGVTGALLNSEFGARMAMSMLGGSWMIVLVGFMIVGMVANRFAMSMGSPVKQYLGLGMYVVAQSVIFVPLLFIATRYSDASVVPTAGLLTAIVFGGLTATALLTKKDFSFMGRMLQMAGFAAIGFIVVSLIFGFTLGSLFSAAMVVLCAGYILYDTSNVMRHYPIGSHVAASLALFSSVATMFWYIVTLLMDRD
ncbi:MAG: Bax inhibitor-1 family protein [Myxococcota bacterium]|nr:Bax inhibitor-1 family protein [Myxococcota bacterium]